MMAPTHVLAGLAGASLLVATAPEHATVGALAAAAGGVAPDLDALVGTHRRTLHSPVYGTLVAAPAVALAALAPSALTVALAAFLGAAALHAVADALEGGRELRPWERTTDRAVYSHYHGRWLRARRLVRYDGAPEDLVLAALLAVPSLAVLPGALRWLPAACLAVAVPYALVRRRIPGLVERFRARTRA
ncbi:hypothetical protein BRC94_04060 [Halobacteriales archaeon QS_5_70_17]|jgi:hypothetical protein|nr:MAG: hypothetical protein BRC94_04060 [Halobacteriales archaeon QS_5_70_17]